MTLTDFLLARIAEDEAQAREAITERDRINFVQYEPDVPDMSLTAWSDAPVPGVLVGPERVLAECEAKRRIVAALRAEEAGEPHVEIWGLRMAAEALAFPYSNHPDYQQEWAA